jgi:hypothetical protein
MVCGGDAPAVLLRALVRPRPNLGLDGSDLDPFELGGSPALASRGGGPGDAVVTDGASLASSLRGGRVEAADRVPRAQTYRCSGWLQRATVYGWMGRGPIVGDLDGGA